MRNTICSPRRWFPLLLAFALWPATGLIAGVPGSATMPPRVIRSPNPPPTPDGRRAGERLLVWIREDGTVEEVQRIYGDEEWFPAVEATVRDWRFVPVEAEGKAWPARVEVEIGCQEKNVAVSMSPLPNLPGEPHVCGELGLVAPVLAYDPEVILPLEGRIMRSTPKVILRYVVEPDGSTGGFAVESAPSEQAVRAALDLVSVQRFRPGTIRDRPVAVEYNQSVGFIGSSEAIAGLEGVAAVSDPVFPYERLLAGDTGRAKVRFRIGADGAVAEATVVEASHPDFGAALAAAVETWVFTEAAAAEQPEREFEYEFAAERAPYGARRLAAYLRAGGAISNKAAGLDERPQLLARPGLVYPRALRAAAVAGSAKIEFVIDRSGLAQVPRVLEASAPEFGWAALTCVNGMRFAPISRGGTPTELRVVLPLQFTPPVPAGT